MNCLLKFDVHWYCALNMYFMRMAISLDQTMIVSNIKAWSFLSKSKNTLNSKGSPEINYGSELLSICMFMEFLWIDFYFSQGNADWRGKDRGWEKAGNKSFSFISLSAMHSLSFLFISWPSYSIYKMILELSESLIAQYNLNSSL